MESLKVRLRKKRGRSWGYQEIEIPTDEEMGRIAAELHSKHEPALINVLSWQVLYVPRKDLDYSVTEIDPFNAKVGNQEEYRSSTISYCVFGYNADWTVCYFWNNGDNQPPTRLHEKGDIVPSDSASQGKLF